MPIRLQKAIAESGLCSRRKAEELIQKGLVRVNGEIAKIGMDVDPAVDKILVNGQYLKAERKIYLMLHKPKNFITTASDPYGRKHVLELVHELAHRDHLAVLIALHDLNLTAHYADRIALMVAGRLRAVGTPKEFLEPGLIEEAYCLPVHVVRHPFLDLPLVLPRSKK